MSSVAYYIPIDQRQADELRHSADASAWAEERLEEAVLNGASIIDDQQWMGMYFALRQLPQAQVTPELPQAATGIEQLGEEPPVVLVPAEAVSAIADALSGWVLRNLRRLQKTFGPSTLMCCLTMPRHR